MRTTRSGATANFTFNGTGVWLYGTTASAGIALSIRVDERSYYTIAEAHSGKS